MYSLSEITFTQPMANAAFIGLVGVVAWMIKNIVFRAVDAKRVMLRREWRFRVQEVYSPLYYWTGALVVRQGSSFDPDICIRKIEEALAKGAYVLPKRHFYVLSSQIGNAFHASLKPPSAQEFFQTRRYLYDQIELLNYYLFKGEALEDVDSDYVLRYKHAFRWTVRGLTHLLVWCGISLVLLSLIAVWHNLGNFWGTVIVVFVAGIVIAVDIRMQRSVRDEVRKRLGR